MSDLISRSALYNKLVELETLARNRVLDTPINSSCYQRYVSQMNERTRLKELVADLPTAYDIEKVVAELEKERETINPKSDIDTRQTMKWFNAELDKHISIVRKGGVNE